LYVINWKERVGASGVGLATRRVLQASFTHQDKVSDILLAESRPSMTVYTTHCHYNVVVLVMLWSGSESDQGNAGI
jgi:hypothetical protein